MPRRCPASQKPRSNASKLKSRSKSTDHAVSLDPTIVFTGNRGNDRYQIIIQGKIVALSLSCLNVLIDLVIARGEAETGFVIVNAVAIYRLRKALDEVVGKGTGNAIIETGNAEEYRLAYPGYKLSATLAITSCFSELVKLKAVTMDRASALELLCQSCQTKSKGNRGEIEKKSNGN